ncbi:PREDICTED: UPF0725 protein At5g63820-like isoform X2 [Brassica oleracea var. oleracea]|uniref:UPF0725 protein At5g63820-like isoform X2 n=1 Tax=Brassica oleracea var. oleracea TaxID=109376 RepID=UPI0006A757D2|nr:PREDICTED: UPF0725 protein At5g63820-like isoform X2 [Brassica oleracea var. oleracea]
MTSLGDMEDDASLMDDLMFSRGGDYSNDALRVVYDADSDGSDIEFRSESGDDYIIELYSRVGVQCHNLQMGTNFKFKTWEMFRIHVSSSDQLYITLEATDPATGSVFSFQTVLFDYRRRSSLGVRTFWLNLTSRIEPLRNERMDNVWDEDTVHELYKGPMPKWFSHDALALDSQKYYVPESELHDNDWLQLLMEVAFFSKADRCLDAYLPLELNSVVVETFEDKPRDKLMANNAIYYLSYKCCVDPCSTPLAGNHLAIMRKTMDGKPGHMSLEVALTTTEDDD